MLTSRNAIAFQIRGEATNDYHITAEIVYEKNRNSPALLGFRQLPAFPSATGLCTFELAPYLNGLVSIDPGDINSTGLVIMENMIRKFKVIFRQIRGVATVDEIETDFYWVIRGGFNGWPNQTLNHWVDDHKFLSHKPEIRRIKRHQLEFAYAYIERSYYNVEIHCNYYFKDKTSVVGDVLFSQIMPDHQVIRFPLNFDQLNLASRPAMAGKLFSDLEHYALRVYSKFTLNSSPFPISNRIRLYVDTNYDPLSRFFYIENSLGGFDTVSTCGEMKYDFETIGSTYQKRIDPFAAQLQHELEDGPVLHRENFEQYVGFSDNDTQLWLRDLLRSEHAYRFGPYYPEPAKDYNRPLELIPINIQRGTTKLFKDNDFLNELKFSYTESALSRGL